MNAKIKYYVINYIAFNYILCNYFGIIYEYIVALPILSSYQCFCDLKDKIYKMMLMYTYKINRVLSLREFWEYIILHQRWEVLRVLPILYQDISFVRLCKFFKYFESMNIYIYSLSSSSSKIDKVSNNF